MEHQFCTKCDDTLRLKLSSENKSVEILPVEDRQECEIWTRVMGYFRPVSQFNIGKKGEYLEREFYKEGVGAPKNDACDSNILN